LKLRSDRVYSESAYQQAEKEKKEMEDKNEIQDNKSGHITGLITQTELE
jgi:hypothetical protein